MSTENYNLFTNAQWMESSANAGYGLMPIPTIRDEELTQLLTEWRAQSPPARRRTSDGLKASQCPTLVAYGERMASLAVRRQDVGILSIGLLAVGLAGWRDEPREGLMALSLLFDAAGRIGTNQNLLVDDVASCLPTEVVHEFTAFLNRSAEDRSIGAMGFRVGTDEGGFRYLYE